MDKWLRIIIIGLSILAAFMIGINVGICLAEKCGNAGAEELGTCEADEEQTSCKIEIWENGGDAGKVVITTRVENINELPGGILVVKK